MFCTSKKPAFKNLTVGKEYPDAIVDGEMVILVNDIGARARYAMTYFSETLEPARRRGRPANAERAEVAPPPPPPPPPTLEQFITLNITRDEAVINTRIRNRATNAELGIISLRCQGSSISCGIYEVSGINGQSVVIRNMQRDIPANVTGNTPEALATMIMNAIFAYLKTSIPAAYYLLSNNLTDDTDLLATWLNVNAISTCTDSNPNSGNEISLWVMSGAQGGE